MEGQFRLKRITFRRRRTSAKAHKLREARTLQADGSGTAVTPDTVRDQLPKAICPVGFKSARIRFQSLFGFVLLKTLSFAERSAERGSCLPSGCHSPVRMVFTPEGNAECMSPLAAVSLKLTFQPS